MEEKPIVEVKNEISIDDFAKVEIRLGTVMSCDVVEGADKLYKLSVDLGETEPRTILSGIREFTTPEHLVGKQFPFVANLAPRKLRGFLSQGMILAAGEGESLALFSPSTALPNGTRLR